LGRKKKEEEHENSERWLVSYADFITLLFAFFTTLYAISTVDAQKAGKMVMSMQQSFNTYVFEQGSKTLSLSQGQGGMDTSAPRDILQSIKTPKSSHIKVTTQVLKDEKELGKLKQSIEKQVGPALEKGIIRTHLEPRGLVISLGEGGFFDSGSSELKPDGRALLDVIAASLTPVGNQMRIEGHTDNVPIRNTVFPSNWELSSGRASNVVRYLIAQFSIKSELLSPAGFAEFRPAASNDTEDGRSRNRRVDIVVLNPAASESEPK
jgi:chemotaxis protein MotB